MQQMACAMSSFACQKNATELNPITKKYKASGLPGCYGLMIAVHMQWSQCPTGDMNRAKGMESFPTLSFKSVTNFNWQIMAVYGPHFGLQKTRR
jgi:hypothetical protein